MADNWNFDGFTLVIAQNVKDRLKDTCFRGLGRPLAGNFMRWRSMKDMMQDLDMLQGVKENCAEAVEAAQRESFTARFTIVHSQPIGWTSATRDQDLTEWILLDNELEQFRINDKTDGLRVKVGRFIYSPLVREVTFAVHCTNRSGSWVCFIKTIYPGENVGRLGPTERRSRLMKGVTFFDWSHIGELNDDRGAPHGAPGYTEEAWSGWGEDAPRQNLDGIQPLEDQMDIDWRFDEDDGDDDDDQDENTL